MTLPPDLIDLLREFATAEVRYLVVGGYALSVHGAPRFTKDVGFWIDERPANVAAVVKALRRFGAPQETVSAIEDLTGLDVAWMGNPPLRFDFMKAVPGGHFDQAYGRRSALTWGGVPVTVVSAEDLLALKPASGRPQDLVGAAQLRSTLAK